MTITTKQPLPQFSFSFIQFLSSSASPSYSYSLESSTTNFLGHQFLYSMETLASSASIAPVKVFSPRFKHKRLTRFTISSKSNGNESDMRSDPNDASIVPMSTYRPFSKDDAMGLVLSAANVRGWTTGSGMEGPSVPAGGSGDNESNTENISTFPWSLFTKSPRRRMRVAFTCNVCGQRTTRAINPHAYTDGTVFVQCCGCNVFHKLVDNLNLFHEMKCYVNPSFTYHDPNENVGSLGFKYLDMNDEEEDDDNMFPIL